MRKGGRKQLRPERPEPELLNVFPPSVER